MGKHESCDERRVKTLKKRITERLKKQELIKNETSLGWFFRMPHSTNVTAGQGALQSLCF
jgi:cell division protein YceG involved in septum cleavage